MGSKEMPKNDDEILSWEETRQMADELRQHGVKQFINLYKAFKDRDGDPFLWGDETEYFLLKLDKGHRKVYLNLRVQTILEKLNALPKNEEMALWKPEFGGFQMEGIPLNPYDGEFSSMLSDVEANMKMRRDVLKRYLLPDEAVVTLTTFPRLGCGLFTSPPTYPEPNVTYGSKSIFISDDVISNDHPRYLAGANNVRRRRNEKIAINIPIYRDINTPMPFLEQLANEESQGAAKVNHVYMDTMTFGCVCSLQVTMQAKNLSQARYIYDQLAVMCPIILALSAASPVHKGYLCNVDCRWDVLSSAKDDRSKEERGLKPLDNDRFIIPKSRHDSIDYLVSPLGQSYNDVKLIYDENVYQQLKDADVDDVLCRHVAHLFIRDPLTLLRSKVTPSDDPTYTEHFENLQSTNWQSMRLKPPPFNTGIGWRVEFRTCEVQASNYENTSYALFIVLLARAIIQLNLNLLVPLSKVEENMKVAQKMDAVIKEKFWFRNDVFSHSDSGSKQSAYSPMTIDSIINGDKATTGFPGLIPIITRYVKENSPELDVEANLTSLNHYMKLLQGRACGKLKTIARWTRDFIASHPNYSFDSVVGDDITYDLIKIFIDNPLKATEPEIHALIVKDVVDQSQVDVLNHNDLRPSHQCQLDP